MPQKEEEKKRKKKKKKRRKKMGKKKEKMRNKCIANISYKWTVGQTNQWIDARSSIDPTPGD